MSSASPPSVPRLRIEGLTKSFFGVQVLHDVSFEAHAGEALGLVGENGSGKSTTMNVLAGVLPRDKGGIWLDGEAYSAGSRRESDAAGVAFIQQELNIFPNLSVAENLFLGRYPRLLSSLPLISGRKLRAQAREWLQTVDLDIDPAAAAGSLSAGERQLVEIARALSSNARLIIFDEPTTSLTAREVQRLFELIGRLRAQRVAIIYISHALDDVLRLCSRVVVMRDGRVTLRQTTEGMTSQDLVVAMVGRSIEALFPVRAPTNRHALESSAERAPVPPILRVDGVSEPGVVEGISLELRRGEILGLSGLMGSGRSELARILFGLDSHRQGQVRLNGVSLSSGDLGARLAAGMAFLTEDRRHEGLMMDASVADNLALAALPRYARAGDGRIERIRLAEALGTVAGRVNLKSGPIESSAVRTLSGGNQQKVVLGRWLLRTPTLFILDEPTRGVDVGAKEEIYRLLVRMADEGMGILVISSEIDELMGLCDRVLVMRRGRLQAQFMREQFDGEAILAASFGREAAA